MRAESNHTRPIHASKHSLKPTAGGVVFGIGLACFIIGLAFIATLEGTTKTSKVKGTTTQLSASQVLAYVNVIRQESGIAPLIVHPALEQAATQKAAHMIEAGYWDHTDPRSGTTPWQFIDATDYRYSKAGENLARDFDDSQQVTEAWMASPPHRANILEPAYTHTGIGIAYGMREHQPTVLVVQLLATPLLTGEAPEPAHFSSAPAVSPQSFTPILLAFSGGLMLISVGFSLVLLSRQHLKKGARNQSDTHTPPLRLWST